MILFAQALLELRLSMIDDEFANIVFVRRSLRSYIYKFYSRGILPRCINSRIVLVIDCLQLLTIIGRCRRNCGFNETMTGIHNIKSTYYIII